MSLEDTQTAERSSRGGTPLLTLVVISWLELGHPQGERSSLENFLCSRSSNDLKNVLEERAGRWE